MLTTAQMSGTGHLATLDLQNSLTLMSKLRSAIVNFVHYKAERPLAPAGSKKDRDRIPWRQMEASRHSDTRSLMKTSMKVAVMNTDHLALASGLDGRRHSLEFVHSPLAWIWQMIFPRVFVALKIGCCSNRRMIHLSNLKKRSLRYCNQEIYS